MSYDINQSPFYRLKSKGKLSELLNVSKLELLEISKNPKYHSFLINSGEKVRHVDCPVGKTRELQERIKKLLSKIESPDWLYSGKRGISYIDNAKFHKDAKYITTCDIKSFYDNCRVERIFQIFKYYFKTSDDVAWVLASLLTYKGKIPTGSPSSQVIAFWAYFPTFLRINEVLKSSGCKISLYVDDITISSSNFISKSLLKQIKVELEKVGHTIKDQKTKSYGPDDFKIVTGVAISPNGTLRVPNKQQLKFIKKIEAMINFGTDEETLKSLKGQINSFGQIDIQLKDKCTRILDSVI